MTHRPAGPAVFGFFIVTGLSSSRFQAGFTLLLRRHCVHLSDCPQPITERNEITSGAWKSQTAVRILPILALNIKEKVNELKVILYQYPGRQIRV